MKSIRFGLLLMLCLSMFVSPYAHADELHQRSRGSISYGETVDGRIRTSEGDSWTFEGQADDIVTISLIGNSLYDPVLELYAPNGIRLALDDDSGIRFDSLISHQRLDESGTYTIVATGFGGRTGSYSLTLEESGGSLGGQDGEGMIELGDTVDGRVTNSLGEIWTFFGEEGQVIIVDAIGQSLNDTVLELHGPDFELLVMDDDGGEGYNSRISGFELPENGNYMLVVRGYDNSTGTYQLSLDEFSLEVEVEGTLAFGETIFNEVNSAGGDRWTFEGVAGDEIAIVLFGTSLEDPYLELYGPDEVLLAEDDDSGPGLNSFIGSFRLAESGTYSIIARGYHNNSTGSYSIILLEGEEVGVGGSSPKGELSYGELVNGEVTSAMGDSWTFDGVQGDVISIDTTGYTLSDTYIELYGPDGELLTEDDDSGNGYFARIAGFRLPSTGTYSIVVRGFGERTGTYDLSLSRGSLGQFSNTISGDPTPQGEVEFGQIVEGNIETEQGDLWTFTGVRGTIIRIEVNGASLEDAYLELYDPFGWQAAYDDDSGEGYSPLIDEYLLLEDGTYSIIVRGYGGETGTYTLEATATGIADVDSGPDSGSDGDNESVAIISDVACGPMDTYFTLTIDGEAAQTWLQRIVIEPRGSASIAQIFPVLGSQMNDVVGIALYDVVIEIGPILAVSGDETLFDIGAMMSQVFDQRAWTGVDNVDITYYGNQGDLKFVVWGSHLEGGGLQVITFWGEQDDPVALPGVPEGLSGELISIQEPCN